MRINQNTLATNAYRNLSTNNMSLGKSLEKLSSGLRINRAADDAAGLVISQNLRAQVGGLRQATRNAQDGISVVQTAEGALSEVHNILGRMRDLSVQAANTGSNDTDARAAAQSEFAALSSEVQRISEDTAFGQQNLLDGSSVGVTTSTPVPDTVTQPPDVPTDTAVTMPAVLGPAGNEFLQIDAIAPIVGFQMGVDYTPAETAVLVAGMVNGLGVTGLTAVASGDDVVFTNATTSDISIDGGTFGLASTTVLAAVTPPPVSTPNPPNVTTTSPLSFQVGANAGDKLDVSIAGVGLVALGLDGLDVSVDAGAAIGVIDSTISAVSAQRGDLGALQNRFESMINNLQVTTENLVASESRIRDTDMAAEMTNFTKSQILSQASTAMLAQANQVPQSILSLLR